MRALASKVLRRLSGVVLQHLSRVPYLARVEYRQYRSLLACALGEDGYSGRPLFARLALDERRVRSVVQGVERYRVIDPTRPSGEDAQWLKDQGLDIDCILQNLPAGDEAATALPQAMSIRLGRLECICPFSGRTIASRSSLLAQTGQPIYYVFREGERLLLLAVGRDTTGFSRLYMYLPDCNLVLLLGSSAWAWLGRNELDQLLAFAIVRASAVRAYLEDSGRSVAALIDHTHFAHQIWNVLPGVQALLDNGVNPAAFSWRVVHEPVAPLDVIFPELHGAAVRRASEAEVPASVLSERLFLVRPGSRRLTPRPIERVRQAVATFAPPALNRRMEEIRRTHWPILWLTVRADTRTWQGFASGMAGILNQLLPRYPRLGVILDGYALPRTQSGPNVRQSASIAAEREIIDALKAGCDQPCVVLELIGDPLPLSIHAASIADCYLAHHGTLQHKVAWFANVPGIVHSNRGMLSGIDGSLAHYPAFAASPATLPPRYLPPDAVTDLPGDPSPPGVRWRNPLENYTVDPQQLLAAMLEMMEALQPRPFPCPDHAPVPPSGT